MSSAPGHVGRSALRVEDEALLRGQGWFIDDLDPLPNTAARRDRPLAVRARPHRRDRRLGRARAADGVHRRRHAAPTCAALSRPFAVGARRRHRRTTPPRSTSPATSASRSASSSRATATSPRTPPSASLVDYEPLPVAAERRGRAGRGRAACCTRRSAPTSPATARFSYGDPDARLRAAPRTSCASASATRARSATPVECYGVIADWDGAAAVTAWANFQGPFTLHGVAAAALGIPGPKLRLLTPGRERRLVRRQGRPCCTPSC